MCELLVIAPYVAFVSELELGKKFRLGGSQYPNQDAWLWSLDHYVYKGDGYWQHFLFPIGMYPEILGRTITHVYVAVDCDVSSPAGEMHWANIKLYEPLAELPSCPPAGTYSAYRLVVSGVAGTSSPRTAQVSKFEIARNPSRPLAAATDADPYSIEASSGNPLARHAWEIASSEQVGAYVVTAGAVSGDRDPTHWSVQGKLSGTADTWVSLHEVAGAAPPSRRGEAYATHQFCSPEPQGTHKMLDGGGGEVLLVDGGGDLYRRAAAPSAGRWTPVPMPGYAGVTWASPGRDRIWAVVPSGELHSCAVPCKGSSWTKHESSGGGLRSVDAGGSASVAAVESSSGKAFIRGGSGLRGECAQT